MLHKRDRKSEQIPHQDIMLEKIHKNTIHRTTKNSKDIISINFEYTSVDSIPESGTLKTFKFRQDTVSSPKQENSIP